VGVAKRMTTQISQPTCPECGSQKTWLAGKRHVQGGEIQRYLCRDCGYRFSDPSFSRKNSLSEIQQTGVRQICVLDQKMKNLVRAKTKNEALQENKGNTKGKIISFAWYLKKLGRTETTITTYSKFIEVLDKNSNLDHPESVKLAIATHYSNRNTKRSACCAYDAYLKFVGGE
jgi:transcriptional regulator NrdR family protein